MIAVGDAAKTAGSTQMRHREVDLASKRPMKLTGIFTMLCLL